MFRPTINREMLIKIKQVSTKVQMTFKADNTQFCEDVRWMLACHAWQGVNWWTLRIPLVGIHAKEITKHWDKDLYPERFITKLLKIVKNLTQYIFFFFWLCHTARRILVPWPGIELGPPAWRAWSLNHWITRGVPRIWHNSVVWSEKKVSIKQGATT